MKVPRFINDTGWLAFDVACCTAIAAGGTALLSDSGWYPLNLGLIGAGSLTLAKRYLWRSPSSYDNHNRKMVQMASITKLNQCIDPDFNSYIMRWKDKPEPPEFRFSGDPLRVEVLESEFHRFIKLAVRRQSVALYGSRATGYRTSYGKFQRLKINWVLGEHYFTKETRPRFHPDLYWSIIFILTVTRLLRHGSRRAGSAGHLIGEYGPDRYTKLAMQRWIALFGPPPLSNSKRSIFNLFTH